MQPVCIDMPEVIKRHVLSNPQNRPGLQAKGLWGASLISAML